MGSELPLGYRDAPPLLSAKGFDCVGHLDAPCRMAQTKSKFFFRHARFYLELDNIFSKLDVGALKFLGSENGRERSWVARDKDKNTNNGYDLVPFIAKGMGLYFQFGVEVQLGI